MKNDSIKVGGIEFTRAAAENIQETGCDPADDVDALRSGEHTRESLLAHCLDGAEADRVQGWRDYVEAVAEAAEEDARYTYTIFDANPQTVGGTEWPSHTRREIEAESANAAVAAVRKVLSSEAGRCNAEDGYEVGQLLHALVWDASGTIVGTPTYALTAEDIGEDERGEAEGDDALAGREDYDV